MNDLNKNKAQSPLVQSVVTLDGHFAELIRLGDKIDGMDMKSEFDYEQTQRLINHFAECGQLVSTEIIRLSTNLNEARARAEAAATLVAARADKLQERENAQQLKMNQFRRLGEKVRDLTVSLNELKKPEGEPTTDEDRGHMSMRLSEFELQLRPLIEEALELKREGQASKMKILEQSADSLGQSLRAVSQKLSAFHKASSPSLTN